MADQPRPNLSTDEAYLAKARDMIQRKEPLEEIHFEYLTEALVSLGIDKDIYEGVSSTSFPGHVAETIEKSFEMLHAHPLREEQLHKVYRLWDYLSESDPLEHADLIYVFGGISELAVLEAIRLKKEDFAPKILFSGKHGSYMKNVVGLTEAEKYAQLAVKNGVRETDIIMEKESINTVENAVNSSKLLRSMNYFPKTIIAVSLPYHMKRAALTLRGGMDIPFRLIRHPGPSAKYSRETYFKDKNGWLYICNEYVKLYMSRQGGHF